MEPLVIKKTRVSPEVNFDNNTGVLSLKGMSLMENPFEFYEPLIKWLVEYVKAPAEKTVFNFRLIYFNSASMVNVSRILRLLSNMHAQGRDVVVRWYYDEHDPNIMDYGKELEELYKVPFELVVIKK